MHREHFRIRVGICVTGVVVCGLLAPAVQAGVVFDDVARTVTVTPERESMAFTFGERYAWAVRPASGGLLEVQYSGGYPYPRIDPAEYDRLVIRLPGKSTGTIVNPGKVGKTGLHITVQAVGASTTTALRLSQPRGGIDVKGAGQRIDLDHDGTADLNLVHTRLHYLWVEAARRGNDRIDLGRFRRWAINVYPKGLGSTINTYRGNDTIIASPGRDRIRAGSGANTIKSLGRRDEIRTGHGNNRIWAGPGDDEVILGNGDNRVWGGPGSDWIKAGKGRNVLVGGKGNDDLMAGGKRGKPNLLVGGPGKDQLWSATNGSWLYGDKGDDTLSGTGARTHLIGGPGNDQMRPNRRKGKIPKINCGKGRRDETFHFVPTRFLKGCEFYWTNGAHHRY